MVGAWLFLGGLALGSLPPSSQVSVRYRVDQPKPYVGQVVYLDLEIAAHPKARFELDAADFAPEVPGAWMVPVDTPKTLRADPKRSSKRERVFRFWRYAVVPSKPGPRTIPAMQVGFRIGGSLFREGKRVTRKTQPLKLSVRRAPPAPRSYQPGNVGSYGLSLQPTAKGWTVGQAQTLELLLRGEGYLNPTTLPAVPWPEGLQALPRVESVGQDPDPERLKGFRKAELSVVPERAGRFEVPAVHHWVLDPQTARYTQLRTVPFSVTVSPAPRTAGTPTPKPSRARPTHQEAEASDPPSSITPPFGWAALLGTAGLLGLMGLGVLFLRKPRRKTPPPPSAPVQAPAPGRPQKPRSQALPNPKTWAQWLDAAEAGTSGALGASSRHLTTEQLMAALQARGEDALPWVEVLKAEIEEAQRVRYSGSPGPRASEARQTRWKTLLQELQKLG